jgi:hypothetical protein
MELRGFGLLNEAGEQVGYHCTADAITIGRNQRCSCRTTPSASEPT